MPAKHVNRKRLQRNMRKACVKLTLDLDLSELS
jgi:hypothetical protein